MFEVVDLVVLSRDDSPLPALVQHGIDAQRGVRLQVHRVFGRPHSTDMCRWETIARARNAGKRSGNSPWLMYLDDDVQLTPNCVYQLVRAMCSRRHYGAMAANYRREGHLSGTSTHVAMGATLFRRSALDMVEFRFEDGRCECQCCCDDLRSHGRQIAYLPTARARHLQTGTRNQACSHVAGEPLDRQSVERNGIVLTCFNRRHYQKFLKRFVASFRAAGNRERIIAFCIGLLPSEVRRVARLWNVEAHSLRENGVPASIRRLHEFPKYLANLSSDAIVAFWDAGDVLFQERIRDFWSLVDANRGKLLVAREPHGHPRNSAVQSWTAAIDDLIARARIFDLVASHPFLNGGFTAGTVDALLNYCQAAAQVQQSSELKGTKEWGDQLALNVYCHQNPDVWQEVESSWNFCLCTRSPKDFQILPTGRYVRTDGGRIHAVHGNGRSFDWKSIARHYG